MQETVFTMEHIVAKVKPLADKYRVKEIYLFGSYARGEADENSDLDFLVYGGETFERTMIFALAEDLRETLEKKVDVIAGLRHRLVHDYDGTNWNIIPLSRFDFLQCR